MHSQNVDQCDLLCSCRQGARFMITPNAIQARLCLQLWRPFSVLASTCSRDLHTRCCVRVDIGNDWHRTTASCGSGCCSCVQWCGRRVLSVAADACLVAALVYCIVGSSATVSAARDSASTSRLTCPCTPTLSCKSWLEEALAPADGIPHEHLLGHVPRNYNLASCCVSSENQS